jgi:hypothetical protein
MPESNVPGDTIQNTLGSIGDFIQHPVSSVAGALGSVASIPWQIGGLLNQGAGLMMGQAPTWQGSDAFPEDLGSSWYGHWMSITAYEGSSLFNGGTGSTAAGGFGFGTFSPVYGVAMFIPTGSGNAGGMEYKHEHRYSEIKLTNLVLGGGLAGASGGGGNEGSIGSILPNALGHPINPRLEVIFNNTNLRNFTFAFMMAPSSEKESQSMKNIITKLRGYAAPKLEGKAGLTFKTPCLFQIKFFNQKQENTNIPKIRACVLTDVTANYAPAGDWATFENGHPVSCMLTLSFSEMEIVHRDMILNGGF